MGEVLPTAELADIPEKYSSRNKGLFQNVEDSQNKKNLFFES